jgi:hypothetical protein
MQVSQIVQIEKVEHTEFVFFVQNLAPHGHDTGASVEPQILHSA